MKLTVLLITIAYLHVSAKVFSQRIDLFEKNSSLAIVFKSIEQQSGYKFFYDNKLVKPAGKVTIELKDVTIEQALDQVLKGKLLTYSIVENVIVIKQKEKSSDQKKPDKVGGKVLDEQGLPLPGVNIQIKKSSKGTFTDAEGRFQLDAQKGDVLVFSFIGFSSKDITYNGQDFMTVTLKVESTVMKEVVVVGYGTQKKVNLTGSVATISGKALESDQSPNSASLLQGRLPGLQVVQGSGQPGAENVQLLIRGLGSYGSSTAPLIIVDGIPGSLPTVENIESVSVLKDAASAAIYGSQAANGVILVTTKRGRTGTSDLIYSTNVGINKAAKLPELITNSVDFMNLWNQAADHSNSPNEKYSQASIDNYKNANGDPLYPNTNWMDLIFGNAAVATHSLTATGGNDKTTYNLNFNYLNQPGTSKGYKFERYSSRLNIETKISQAIRMGANVSTSYGSTQSLNGDMFFGAFTQSPTYGPYLPDGSGRLTKNAFAPIEYKNNINPFLYLDGYNVKGNTFNYQLNPYLRVNFTNWLAWDINASFTQSSGKTKTYSPASRQLYNWFAGNLAETRTGTGLNVSDNNSLSPTLYSTLNFNKTIKDHSIAAMVGMHFLQTKSENLFATRRTYYSDLTQEINAGAGTINNGGTASESAMSSYFGRINYGFKDKYLAELDLRADGNSRFAPGHRWGYFPGGSLGWRFSNEDFMANLTWLSDAKLRASYGKLGNQGTNNYPYQSVVRPQSGFYTYTNNTGGIALGVAPGPLVDENITWEETKVLDFGMDLGLLQNRLTFTFDWFKKNTTRILRQQQIAFETGFGSLSPVINAGAMTNTGFELAADYKGNVGKVNYSLNWNIQSYKNKVTSFGPEKITTNGGYNASIIREGIPYNSFYMYQWDGIFQTQAEADNSGQVNHPKAGDLKMKDLSGPEGKPDGKIDGFDKTVVDGVFPKFSTGFSCSASYKSFDLSAFFFGNYGQKVYVYGYGLEPFYQGSVPTKDWLNAWTPENHSNTMPAVYNSQRYNSTWTTYPNTWFLRDASYLRLKNLNIGWSKEVKKFGFKSIRIYLAGENLVTFTKFKGLDPERAATTGNYMTYPQNRSYSVGANLKF